MNLLCVDIPESVTHLIFDEKYTGDSSVVIINNKCTINKVGDSIGNYLIPIFLRDRPLKKLEYLELNNNFNESIKGTLPKNLKTLIFGSSFNKSFDKNDLPEFLLSLTLGSDHQQILINIPESLMKLELVTASIDVFNSIPPTITILIIYGNLIYDHICCKIMNNLPPVLEKLIINYYTPSKKMLLKKIPFGCVVYDEKKNIIQLD